MRGEFIGVWAEMRREIWSELVAAEAAPANLYSELYSALAPALRVSTLRRGSCRNHC